MIWNARGYASSGLLTRMRRSNHGSTRIKTDFQRKKTENFSYSWCENEVKLLIIFSCVCPVWNAGFHKGFRPGIVVRVRPIRHDLTHLCLAQDLPEGGAAVLACHDHYDRWADEQRCVIQWPAGESRLTRADQIFPIFLN